MLSPLFPAPLPPFNAILELFDRLYLQTKGVDRRQDVCSRFSVRLGKVK